MYGSKTIRTAINGLYTVYDYTLYLPLTITDVYSIEVVPCLMDHGRTNNNGNQRLYHDDILPIGLCDDECRCTRTNINTIMGSYLFKTSSIQYKDEYSVSVSFYIEGII